MNTFVTATIQASIHSIILHEPKILQDLTIELENSD